MKKYLFAGLMVPSMIFLFNQNINAACDQCQRPQIALYDCKVVPSRPEGTDSAATKAIIAWRDLFWVSAGVKDWVMNSDPNKSCVTILDGAFLTKNDTVSNSIKFGDEWCNLPPDGNAPGSQDYLITGTVDGSEGNYTATISIQVSKTRETVAQASQTFTNSLDALDAGRSAAAQFGSLITKIREFEKKKRSTGEPYALWPTAELIPEKNSVKKNEAIDVEVRLYDCDGDISTSPLPQRKVTLSATGGKIEPTEVTTGPDGIAHATFTAGDKPCAALLHALCVYKLASEYESTNNGGYASVQIEESPEQLWVFKGDFSSETRYDETQTTSLEGTEEYSSQHSDNLSNYRMNGVIRNKIDNPYNVGTSTYWFESDSAPLSVSMEGRDGSVETDRGYTILSSGWLKNWAVKNDMSSPKPSKEYDQSLDFLFMTDSVDDDSRSFFFNGFDIIGNCSQQGQQCSSLDGCKDDSYNDECQDDFSEEIIPLESESGINRDTTYTDDEGEQWKVKEKATILKTDKGYDLYRYFEAEAYHPPLEGAYKDETRHYWKEIFTGTLRPLSDNPSKVTKGRTAHYISDGCRIYALKSGVIRIDLSNPRLGKYKITLLDLMGRKLLSTTNELKAGNSLSFIPNRQAPGIYYVKVNSDDGKFSVSRKIALIR